MKVNTDFGTYNNCVIVTDKYAVDGALYVRIDTVYDDGFREPLAIITKCLDDKALCDSSASYIDTNNCPWALDFIKEYGLGELIEGAERQSGFCVYPLVEFNMDKLEGII